MGNCIVCKPHCHYKHTLLKGGYRCDCTDASNYVYHVALKNPHGLNYIYYEPGAKSFKGDINIHNWLKSLYSGLLSPNGSPWTNWIVYNDEPPLFLNKTDSSFVKPKATPGHCKGIVAWNEHEMSWLIHSVPCFPVFFCPEATGELQSVFSDMRHSEEIYGQSFGYFYLSWEKRGEKGGVGEKRICELLEHIR